VRSSGCFSGATLGGWSIDAALLAPLIVTLALYMTGIISLWRKAGVGHGVSLMQVACFFVGWLCMAAALVSPLHQLSRQLFVAHMIEHELVMAIAAPFLVLSRPLGRLLWAFPGAWRRPVARFSSGAAYLAGWDVLSRPIPATVAHAAAIWFWHVPAIFDAALGNEALHWLQHLSFLVTALFFWWAMFVSHRQMGTSIACLFVTGLHTGALGILLAMAQHPMYPLQARLAEVYGMDPLSDQQLAGIVMWIPAGFIYVSVALALAGLWIARSSRLEETRVRSA